MSIRRSKGEKLFNIINNLFLALLMLVSFYPLLHVAFVSLSDSTDLMMHQGLMLRPKGFSIEAYKMVFKNPMIIKGYMNTLFILVVGTSWSIFLTSFGAYVLSRKNVYWRNAIMFFVVFTMFFNGGLIPFYFTVRGFKLDNTLWSLFIPFSINTFNLIIMRTSFAAIPDSMEESAKMDGANDFTVLFRIIMPLSLPVIAVMILYYGVSIWNAWFYAMIFIRTRSLYPLQLILREILIQNDMNQMMDTVGDMDKGAVGETVKHATIMVATLPILFVYPFLQKYFVKGVMIGAIKG